MSRANLRISFGGGKLVQAQRRKGNGAIVRGRHAHSGCSQHERMDWKGEKQMTRLWEPLIVDGKPRCCWCYPNTSHRLRVLLRKKTVKLAECTHCHRQYQLEVKQ